MNSGVVCPMRDVCGKVVVDNEVKSTSSHATPRVIVCCRDTDLYHELIARLTRDYIVTITAQLDNIADSLEESQNQVVLIEVPENEELFISILRELFKKDETTRIIILGGCASRASLAEAFRIGVCDYFPEPVNSELLIERLGVLININI